MMRIGILGIDYLTENFLVELFRLDPCAHVFLSAADTERANLLARKFPCWIQDNGQAVVDEADTVLITQKRTRSGNVQENIEYRETQLILFTEVMPLFNHHDISAISEQVINRHIALHRFSPCVPLTDKQIDNYLFVLRVHLMSMRFIRWR